MPDILPNPFFFNGGSRFELDEAKFMADIEPPPAFLANPSAEYLSAMEIGSILEVIAGPIGGAADGRQIPRG